MIGINDSGLTTIENVRETLNTSYIGCHTMTKIMLKAWEYHSESRNKKGNSPFTFDIYTNHMRTIDYLEQINLNMLNCDDIGGKEAVVSYLENRILR